MLPSLKRPLAIGIALLVVAFFYYVPPLPQDPAYHDFADQRVLFGVPHFWNVASNLPIVIVGLLGMRRVWRGRLQGGLPALHANYVLVQFLPVLLLPILLLGVRSSFAGAGYVWAVLAAYTGAKLLEWQDAAVLQVLGELSGHSLKHIAAAAAGYLFLLALERRQGRDAPRAATR